MLYLKKNILDQLVEWSKEEYPNEAAGYLFEQNSLFKKIITGNHSVVHFYDENIEQLAKWIEKYGKPTAIFHSHPGEAIPSGTDYVYMKTSIPFFKCIWIIMSSYLKIRAWTLGSWVGGSFTGSIELEVRIIA